MILQGNSYADNYKYIEISIEKCEGAGCRTDAEIYNAILNTMIDLTVVNTYFDFENYDQPIQKFLDDRFTLYLLPEFKVTSKVYLKKNTAEIQDGFFYFTPDGDESSFISFERVQNFIESYSSDENVYFCKLAHHF
jgi:hypothetical protein